MKISVEVEVPDTIMMCFTCDYYYWELRCQLFRQTLVDYNGPCEECLAARKQAEQQAIDDACATEDYLNEDPEEIK